MQGQWPAAAALVGRLQKGGSITADEVFMTIVRPGPVVVRASVEEKDRSLVAAGAACKVTPTALPEMKLAGKIERIGVTPIGGAFDVIVALDPAPPEAVVPGMACSVKVVTYTKLDAIVVPAMAVFDDEADEDRHYVYKSGAGTSEKRTVTVGKRSSGRAEITKGLEVGDEILLTKP